MKTLKELRARRAAIEARFRELNAEAGDADFSAEQQTEWDGLEAEHRGVLADIETGERAEKARESRAKWGTLEVSSPVPTDDGADVRSLTRQQVVSRAQKIAESQTARDIYSDIDPTTLGFEFDGARAQEHVQRLARTQSRHFNGEAFSRYMVASESDAYRSAFGKLLARGSGAAMLTSEEARAVELVHELRVAMNITTDTQGGFGVPVLIDPSIILTGQGHPNDFFRIARVENITTDEWRGVTSAGATSYWTTEGQTFTDGSPTLAQPTVTTKKLTTLVKYTFEVQGDYPSFAAEVAAVMAASHNEKIVEGLTIGTGTAAQPTGIVTALKANAGTSQVVTTTDGSMGAVDFANVRDALPIRFRSNSQWMMSTKANSAARLFGNGNNISNFTVDLTEDGAYRILGRVVNLNDYMDAGPVTATSDVVPAILGDWRNFLIANRVGATVETMQHVIDTTTGNPNGQRATFMWARIGSNVINPNAFRYMRNVA